MLEFKSGAVLVLLNGNYKVVSGTVRVMNGELVSPAVTGAFVVQPLTIEEVNELHEDGALINEYTNDFKGTWRQLQEVCCG